MKPVQRPIDTIELGVESVTFQCAGNRQFVVTKQDVNTTVKLLSPRKQQHVAENSDAFVVHLRARDHQRITRWAAILY